MKATATLWAVVIAYLIISISAGVITARREEADSLKGYFHSTISPSILAFTIVATGASGVALVGMAGTVSVSGVSTWIFGTVGALSGYVMTNLLLGRPMSRLSALHNQTNVPDMLEYIYRDTRLGYLAVPAILLIAIIFCSAEWASLGRLTHSLIGISYRQAIMISAVVVGIYAISGGNKSTAIVSAFQIGIAAVVCVILTIAAIRVSGGLKAMHDSVRSVNPELLNPLGPNNSMWGKAISYLIIYSVGMLGQPQIIVKFFQIKSPKLLPKCLFMTTATFSVANLPAIVGLVAIEKIASGEMPAPESSDGIMAAFIGQFCDPVIGGLVVSACLAAIMSTIAALLLSASTSLVKVMLGDWLKIDMSGAKGVNFGRTGMLICLVISVALAMNPYADIFTMGAQAWGGYAAIFAPTVLFGLRWRRATKHGAFWSMLTGSIIYFACAVLNILSIRPWPYQIDFPVVALGVSIIAMIVVSLATPNEDKSHFMPPSLAEIERRTM